MTAVNLYKDTEHGRKSIASATNGTDQGKRDFKMIKQEDVKFERSYGEVSGAVEKIMRKMGSPVVPSHLVGGMVRKDVEVVDGEYYKRSIGGHDHMKVMLGFPKKKSG